ncbi:MAG TPA: hypothetical protein VIV58_17650 [Kofleriaceae bacterium]
MIASRYLFAALLATASLTACIDPGDETLGETADDLSTSSWWGGGSALNNLGNVPAMAMLNGAEYYVYPWDDGSAVLPGVSHDLYWHKCDSTGCTSPKRIPGQLSLGRVNLAAYNGFIYMVHQGDSDSTEVWFTRLTPSTGQWTSNVKLSFATVVGAPALAAFNNRLYMVGSRKQQVIRNNVSVTTFPLWYASMDTNEVWSPTGTLWGEESASPPSLAVFAGQLYAAHRWGQTSQIVVQTLPAGGTWSAVQHIFAGVNNANIEGDDVQIAAVNGWLHLVHHRWSGSQTWWTYFNQCNPWAPEVTVPSYNFSSRSSMATSRQGLSLYGLYDSGLWPYTDNNWRQINFNAPPPPIILPNCGIGIGGLGNDF